VRAAIKEKRRKKMEEFERLKAAAPFVNSYSFSDNYKELVEKFRTEDYVSEIDKAFLTLELMQEMTTKQWKDCVELMNCAESMYQELKTRYPHEFTPLNMILRWKKNILDEYMACVEPHFPVGYTGTSAYYANEVYMTFNGGLATLPPLPSEACGATVSTTVRREMAKVMVAWGAELRKAITEIRRLGAHALACRAPVLLTHAFCPLTARLVAWACRARPTHVCVLETAPSCVGYLMLDELDALEAAGTRQMVADASAEPFLRGATALLTPAVAVAPCGSVVAVAGALALAVLARRLGVQVLAVAPTFVFHPVAEEVPAVLFDPRNYQQQPASHGTSFESHKFDLIPPDYITEYITERGCKTREGIGSIHELLYGSQFAQLEDRKDLKRPPKKPKDSKGKLAGTESKEQVAAGDSNGLEEQEESDEELE